MNTTNQNKASDIELDDNFDVFCQGFDGESFYGLEYILDDFFQRTIAKSSVPVQHSVDWFGLNT